MTGKKTGVFFVLFSAVWGYFPLGPMFYYPVVLAALVIVFFINKGAKQKRLGRLTLYVGLAFILAILIDYRLFYFQLFSDFVSHRESRIDGRVFSLSQTINNLFSVMYWSSFWGHFTGFLANGQTHYNWNPNGNYRVNLYGFGAFVTAAIIWVLLRKQTMDAKQIWAGARFLALSVLALVTTAALFAFFRAGFIDTWALLQSPMQLDRFIVFSPLAASLLIFGALIFLERISLNSTSVFIHGLALLMAVNSLFNFDAFTRKYENTRRFILAGYNNPYISRYTIGTNLNTGLYDALKQRLGENWADEKIMSIGMSPMTASYHGFSHLDGYFNFYPASYKQEFRQIIAGELEKNLANKNYYDGWGQRVRLYPALVENNQTELDFNACAFIALGGTLVHSTYEITNAAETGLVFLGKIEGVTEGLESKSYAYRPIAENCPT